MRILLDEDVPGPIISILEHVLRDHEVQHIHTLRWSSKTDPFVYRDARAKGYNIIVTNDGHQMTDPKECREVKRSGLHRVAYEQKQGLRGLAFAASITAAMPDIVVELANADSQRLVAIVAVDASHKRYQIIDPRRNPPRYWPR